jgi:hypothetical protein
MIDRLILSAVLGTVGWNGMFPDPPTPLTLKEKAKERSMNPVCDKKKKTKTVKQLCKRWEAQKNG